MKYRVHSVQKPFFESLASTFVCADVREPNALNVKRAVKSESEEWKEENRCRLCNNGFFPLGLILLYSLHVMYRAGRNDPHFSPRTLAMTLSAPICILSVEIVASVHKSQVKYCTVCVQGGVKRSALFHRKSLPRSVYLNM